MIRNMVRSRSEICVLASIYDPTKNGNSVNQRLRLFQAVLLCLALMFGVAAAAIGDPLGDGIDALDRKDYASAISLWRPLAEHGDANAQAYLGLMYQEGWGVQKDLVAAVAWYRLAAAQEHASAQEELANCYEKAEGTNRDMSLALSWHERAANHGLVRAQLSLGVLFLGFDGVQKDNISAFKWLDLAAKGGKGPKLGDDSEYVRKSVQKWAAKNRDSLAMKMSPEELAEANRLESDWHPN